MAGQSANYRDLLDFVRSIDGRGIRPDVIEIQQRLEAAKPIFQNLLRYKVDLSMLSHIQFRSILLHSACYLNWGIYECREAQMSPNSR